jgi:hypothetical protein
MRTKPSSATWSITKGWGRRLLDIESLLQDDRLNDQDRYAFHGAQQALRNIFEPDTWQKS